MFQIAVLPSKLDFHGSAGARGRNSQWNRIGILIDNNRRIESPRPSLQISLGRGTFQLRSAAYGNPQGGQSCPQSFIRGRVGATPGICVFELDAPARGGALQSFAVGGQTPV